MIRIPDGAFNQCGKPVATQPQNVPCSCGYGGAEASLPQLSVCPNEYTDPPCLPLGLEGVRWRVVPAWLRAAGRVLFNTLATPFTHALLHAV